MPPEADVEIGTLDGSGINLSLILSKNDMFGDGVEEGDVGKSKYTEMKGIYGGQRKCCA